MIGLCQNIRDSLQDRYGRLCWEEERHIDGMEERASLQDIASGGMLSTGRTNSVDSTGS